MNKFLFALVAITIQCTLFANDGAYFASGNHIVPIVETDIEIRKEILSITKIGDEYISVKVEYIFFNPVAHKTILVGFEAPSPGGDVDGEPVDGGHPYIYDFTVEFNGRDLPYTKHIVTEEKYYKDGKILSKTVDEVVDDNFNPNSPEFNYVYTFEPTFEKGLNKVVHTYRFRLSGSVVLDYDFDYILTAANRWTNKQIDDFTLIIDLGPFQDVYIDNLFFDSKDEWLYQGRAFDSQKIMWVEKATRFIIEKGPIVFQKRNFSPKGELRLFCVNYFYYGDDYNYKELGLPYQINASLNLEEAIDNLSYKILRNLPFARRGYVFKNSEIQKFYESMDWYVKDPDFVADIKNVTEEEKSWIYKVDKANKQSTLDISE